MKKKEQLYPGVEEAEKMRSVPKYIKYIQDNEEPDTFGVVPNYEKFERWGWDCEKILVWLNMD